MKITAEPEIKTIEGGHNKEPWCKESSLAPRRHYNLEPDYCRALPKISKDNRAGMVARLGKLYGGDRAPDVYRELERRIRVHLAHKMPQAKTHEEEFEAADRFTEKDVVLITYGDLIASPGVRPLEALASFAEVFFKDLITTIHILPFYPYSSDRGFAVISYTEVDAKLGSWEDINKLGRSFRLMFDGVFNHISSQSEWFREFLNGNPDYQKYFISFSSHDALDDDHLKLILRPRTSSILADYATINGTRYVWTTFSRDQIDINVKEPKVLLEILDVLLFYVRQGADLIRLDAITYLWYELGTSCAHLDETHECIKLMREVLDVAAPEVALITETNVPHLDNISYFGNGYDEAQMVYNFALPSLVLLAFLKGDSTKLTLWAAELEYPSPMATFFNFLDSHDGISVMGGRGILSEEEIGELARKVEERGGFVSMKSDGSGGESPYELNITWWSALNPESAEEDEGIQIDRFIASRAIALSLRGVPGIYLPSLIGSKNDLDGVISPGGTHRDINRAELEEPELMRQFSDPSSRTHRIYWRFRHLLELRVAAEAFHPAAEQVVLEASSSLFVLLRKSRRSQAGLLAVISIVDHPAIETVDLVPRCSGSEALKDLISGQRFSMVDGCLSLKLKPYQVLWLPVSIEA